MASTTLTTPIRRRLSTFAKGLARPFTDSRRRNFICDMLTGLVAGGHVHLTAVARGISRGTGNIHAVEKRLSRNLASEHWEADPIAEELLQRSAALVTEDTLIPGDTTDLAKYYAKHLEGLGRVHDGSDPEGRTAPGYCVFEAYVRVGKWQLVPLLVEPLKVYAGAATGENAELLRHILRIHEAAGRKGTWVLDRGFDRRGLYGPLFKNAVAFVVRQRGDRTVRTADGREVTIEALVAEQTCPCPKPWPGGGVSVTPGRVVAGGGRGTVPVGDRLACAQERTPTGVAGQSTRAACGSNGEVVRARVPPALGCGGRGTRDQAAVHGGAVLGAHVARASSVVVAGGVVALVAELVGRGTLRPAA